MNVLKAAYCRGFQLAFRAAMPLLPYRTPEELDSVLEIPEKMKELGVTAAILVTDSSLRSLGLTARLEEAMAQAGIRCPVYDGTVANPTIRNIEEALALYKAEGCAAIIGFGGGSSMDCAKGLGARIARPDKTINQLEGILKIHRALPPLFAVPTTAGTGSETTLAAVIVDDETRHKFPINDFPLIPAYAVLDAQNTLGLPPSLTATTGMDALTHAVEAYIGRSTTADTRACAVEAVQLVMRYLERAYTDGSDVEARQQMLRAAYLAGRAFTKSYVGYCHAVAHSLGGLYNTPHGLANSVLLPYVLRSYGSSAHKKLKALAVAAGIAREASSPAVASELFIRRIEAMNRRMGIPEKLSGIRPEDIELMARRADREGNPLYPVPRLMDARELERFYVEAAEDLTED